VGRFLEHSRVWSFHADGEELTFLSSADWMARNFFRRVETAFPIEDARLKARVLNEGLVIPLSDNAQAWILFSDGHWKRVRPGRERRAGQEVLLEELSTRGGGEGPDMDELRRARAR